MQPVLVWNGHYGFLNALGRMVKEGASVKTKVCGPIVAEPATDKPYGMLFRAVLQQTVQE